MEVCLKLSMVSNSPLVYLSTNAVQHQHTKRIEIDLHFVWDKVTLGVVQVFHVLTSSQYANIFTEDLRSSMFCDFRSNLKVCLTDVLIASGWGGLYSYLLPVFPDSVSVLFL